MFNVLLIDDEPWVLMGLRRIFNWENYGFHVVSAVTSSLEGLSILGKMHIDVVLSDIRMPDLTGLELLEEAKNINPNITFILVSGFADFEYAQEALRKGAYDYLLKPIDHTQTNSYLEQLSQHLHNLQFTKVQTEETTNPIEVLPPSAEHELFVQMTHYMKEHIARDIYLKDLADYFHLNFTYCSEFFKKHAGITFSKYLTKLRMEKACDLLLQTTNTIEDIAFQCGYHDYSYFNKVFKNQYSQTPNQYRKRKPT